LLVALQLKHFTLLPLIAKKSAIWFLKNNLPDTFAKGLTILSLTVPVMVDCAKENAKKDCKKKEHHFYNPSDKKRVF